MTEGVIPPPAQPADHGSGPPAIRVLVADDHGLLRFGVVTLLNEAPGVRVVGEAADGVEAVRQYAALRPDVALIDLRMPGLDGVGVVAQVCARFPGARVVVLTTYDADDDIERALRAGAKAYLLKDTDPQDLVGCVRAVHAGRTWVSPAVAAKLAERLTRPELTPREMDVLRELAAGRSNKEIGAALGMAEGTVKVHVSHVYEKLGVQSRTEALTIALQRGLLRLP